MRIEQALSKSSGVVEKLLLHTEIEMNDAIGWMEKKRRDSSDFAIDDSVIQALFRFRQTCLACSVNASINAEAGDTYTASKKLQKDQQKLFNLLYQLVNLCIGSSNNKAYKTLLDKGMLALMPIERLGLWIERLDSGKTLNNVIELLRKDGFASDSRFSSDTGDSTTSLYLNRWTSIEEDELPGTEDSMLKNTKSFFDLVDGVYEDLERLKGYSLEYEAMHSMNFSIHEYRKMLQIDELQEGRQLIFFLAGGVAHIFK